jgi:exoribonuclease R
MAGRNHRGRKKRPNRQGRTNKGPQTPDDERLWRRVTQHFNDDGDWQRVWTPEEIVIHIAEKEGLKAQFHSDGKAERALLSKVNEALALGRKQRGHILPDEDKSVRFRSQESINELDKAANDWKNFFSRHAGKGDTPLSGRPPLNEEASEEDRDLYALLEETWGAMLRGERLPERFALDSAGTRHWKGFDVAKEARLCAVKRSGLRFPDEEPAMALLLMTAERWTARELLDARLSSRRKAGYNPFPRTYDARLVAHADALDEIDGDGEVARGRSDLRHLPFVTIDPPDAKDFDDAVCLVENDGTRTLWVAIADVAHYVQAGTSLDQAAAARATSVYLPHAVLPMLPPKLADELCSLRSDVDRLAMVVGMDLDSDNTIVHTHAYEAVIHVKANIAYGDVLNTDAYDAMLELAGIWQEREIRLNLNNPELRPRLHGENELRVEVKWPNKATRMIESFMVATNAAVGHLLGGAGAPLPWRCHAPPGRPEVQELNAKLEALGVGIELPMPSLRKHSESETQELSNLLGDWAGLGGGGIDLSELKEETPESDVPLYLREVIDPEARDGILTSLQEAQASASSLAETTRRIVDQGLFQLMTRAKYSEENQGHFGLNLDAYVHFTSPIRRYPDLMTHRQLKAFIHDRTWVHDREETARLASHCSEQGMAAKRLEWELVANTYHVHLLRGGRIGEGESPIPTSYNARVTGLRTPWIFLDLADDGAVSGRMHLRQLGGKRRLVVDDFGLAVTQAEPDYDGDYPTILRLGQRFPCRLRGLDVWSGSLDLTPV